MVGRTVAHYRIVAELGAGGMGIVYKAQDVRLQRFLALKFLKPELVTEDFRRRFLQEARASSALHHPNIVHVYDIGAFEGQDYIAMEFVDGQSLRQILRERRLSVLEAVRYSVQITDAMATAHAAGIVHRDLKPANLMITPAGLVKILDFGLAKQASHAMAAEMPSGEIVLPTGDPEATNSAITITADRTQLGVAVGSPAYMSPEQAMGGAVDGRSDIFSFGSILFEMLVGRRLFPGEATKEVISNVIKYAPPPPSLLNPEVGSELDALVQRAIQKDPAKRFQRMDELKAALEAFQGVSSAGLLVESPALARSRQRMAIMAAVALVVIVLLAYLAIRNRPATFTDSATAPLEAQRLTLDPGLNVDPAISPDGKYVAYSSDRSGEGYLDIWVRPISGGGDPIRLTHDPADDRDPVFSPDGAYIAFHSNRDGGGIYMVPTLGGEEQALIPQGRRPRFSPDGKQIAYWKGLADPFPLRAGNGSSFVFDLATRQSRQIAADFPAAVDPVWSPDGRNIVVIGLKDPADVPHTFNWWIVPLAGGPPVYCPVNTINLQVPFAWRGDQIFYETGGGQIGSKIGRVRINPATFQPIGPLANLTAGTTDEFCPSISRDGVVVFSAETRNTNLYALPLDVDRGKPVGAPQSLTRDLGENSIRSVSADGKRIVFLTRRPTHDPAQVWVLDLVTGRQHALTAGGRGKNLPEISPDGSFVVWRENSTNVTEIFVTPFDGGSATKLCSDCQGPPVWSADSQFVLVSQPSMRGSIAIVERAGGRQSLYMKGAPGLELRPRAISRDGRWLAFTAHRSQANYTVYVAPFAPDRAPAQSEWIEVATSADAEPYPRLSRDASLLYFGSTRDGYACLWAQRLNPRSKRPEGKPFAVQHFHLPTLGLQAPSFSNPFALAGNQALVSITERVGALWTLNMSRQK